MISLRVTIVLIAIVTFAHSLEHFEKALFKDAKSNLGTRIVNGSPASRYQYPYQVSYQVDRNHHCGASILTRYWVLTAAHCIVGNPSDNQIVAGLLNLGESNRDIQFVPIAKQIPHPKYPGGVGAYDIGLLQLQYPLYWSDAVQPIQLPQNNQEFYGYTWVTGWGYLDSSESNPSTTLQRVPLKIISYDDCANRLTEITGQIGPLDNTMICAVGIYYEDQAICSGDSGGPMQQNGILVGVTSWTINPCGYEGAPSVFTKVSTYLSFIRQYVPNV